MRIELGPPETPPVVADPDIGALADAMSPGVSYPAGQLYAAYSRAVRAEGRNPVSLIGLGKRLGRDKRFIRTHTRVGTVWTRS